MSNVSNSSLRIAITFKNTDSTEPLKKYASEKLVHCIQKFLHQDAEVHVILAVEKVRQIAEASFHAFGVDFFAREESTDLYASIDKLCDSLSQQLRKQKEKVKNHH
jgi:putative sigma-54 modulation protein